MSIAPPAEHVREDEPLAYRSRGSHRAAALEQLARHPDHLCRLQASSTEAQGESRHATEDGMVVREVLRFDKTWPRTSRSSNLIKSKVPTPLETNRDLDNDLVVGPRAPSAALRVARIQSCCAVGRLQLRSLHSRAVRPAVQISCPVAGGHHSRIV